MIRFLLAGWIGLVCVGCAAPEAPRPNIVLIVADDLGYGDVGCYGHPVARTPHIDRLAAEGVRFTQHYSSGPECSTTRTALLTGRYPQRVGGLECAIGTGNVGRYDDAIRLAEKGDLGLPVSKAVLPRALKEVGYRSAIFGKWHLGYEKKFLPLQYGWDRFFGCLGGNVDYWTHRELSPLPVLYENNSPIERQGYMTHLIAEEAIAFIRSDHGEKPFFCYVPLTTPHFPYQPPGRVRKVNKENWTDGTQKQYVAMLEDMDATVGRIEAAADKTGRQRSTLFVFVSDNGGTSLANHKPFRGLKSGLLEGGIRVPLVARWPGRLPAGKVSQQVCATFDLTASILAAAGAEPLPGRPLEGMDVLGRIADRKPPVDRTLYWRSKRGTKVWRAVREGDLKYVRLEGIPGAGQWLYDLSTDPGEKQDLLGRRSEDAERLKKKLSAWEQRVRPMR
ncbi:MAG: sulfatase-like hydrolase/transferase [Phycisphaeraceae bacterium]|nr:sulfatase-like hydrolase/transferase [Phycisphaeraceae bacterium]